MVYFADLHCDLLSYLQQKKGSTPENDECRSSISLLKKGRVALQTLAIYSETNKGSVASAARQFEIFETLPYLYAHFTHLKKWTFQHSSSQIAIAAAIENASCICLEEENVENAFRRLDSYADRAGPILYISLTWNHENRFGGGAHTQTGLKRDGELLLEYLDGRKIAIDLSHASDPLGYDILNFIEKRSLNVTPIASHSNFREICTHERNLPDHIAKEIAAKGGIIGLNFVKPFLGKNFLIDLLRHIEHAKKLGITQQLSLGADFFYDGDEQSAKNPLYPFFDETFSNSSCYPQVFNFLESKIEKDMLANIAHRNVENYFNHMAKI